ncbi:MAG: hypothetical protein E7545_08525 [Ruminococcaceae bacterium]|nr:hypothetical protein [Oscillospiraceae bacterium]
MQKVLNKKMFVLGIVLGLFLIAIITASAFSLKCRQENPNSWILQSYENTVVLLNNGEVVEVFGNISLDTLPPEDLKHLESGISFLTKEEALLAIEDYDG